MHPARPGARPGSGVVVVAGAVLGRCGRRCVFAMVVGSCEQRADRARRDADGHGDLAVRESEPPGPLDRLLEVVLDLAFAAGVTLDRAQQLFALLGTDGACPACSAAAISPRPTPAAIAALAAAIIACCACAARSASCSVSARQPRGRRGGDRLQLRRQLLDSSARHHCSPFDVGLRAEWTCADHATPTGLKPPARTHRAATTPALDAPTRKPRASDPASTPAPRSRIDRPVCSASAAS